MCSEPARMPAKYYIYAGGRWCEVDTRQGRVSGWRQRARFCFLRGGRLEVARTARVLRALRALASGTDGAARDAAPLPRRRPHRPRRDNVRDHHCCSQHLHHSRCDLNANDLSQKPPLTLPASTPLTAASPRKRKRSSEDDRTKAKQPRNREPEGKTAKQSQPSQKSLQVKDKNDLKIVQSLLDSSSSEDKKECKKSQKSKAKIRSQEEEELVRSLLQSSSEDSKSQNSKVKKQAHEAKLKQSQKKAEDKVFQSSPSADRKESPQKTKSPQRGKEEAKIVQSLLQSSSSEDGNEQRKPQPKSKKSDKSDSSSESSVESTTGACKELVIDDGDVAVLRKFLARAADGTDLERFDKDNEYKTSVLYKLNPLVVLKRCKPLERLLLQRMTIEEFARHLGLRSVADVTPEKRYRMRHSTRRVRRARSDSQTDKENVVRPKRRQLWNRDRELFNSRSPSEVRQRLKIPKPTRDSSNDSNDSDAAVKQNILRNFEKQTKKNSLSPKKDAKKRKDDNRSVVISDSDTDKGDDTKGKSGDKDNDSVVVSDDTDSDVKDKPVVTRRTRASVPRKDNESVIVSDDSKSTGNERPVRRTRSKGSKRRVLREHNKSVVISDTDSTTDVNRDKSAKPKATENRNEDSKSIVVSDECSYSNQHRAKNLRSRSRDPDRALKEQNKSVNSNKKEETDTKAKKDVEVCSVNSRTTRSSMRGTDNETKEKNKTESSKKDIKQSSSKAGAEKKDNPRPAKRELRKGSKVEVAPIESQDKSVISDSDSAFGKSAASPKKKENKMNKKEVEVRTTRGSKGRVLDLTKEVINAEKTSKDKSRNNENLTEKVSKENDSSEGKKTNDKQREIEKDGKSKRSDNRTGDDNNKRKNEKASAVVRNMYIKPVKVKKSCVANGREYTSLEDHAIVAWVSIGQRERLVNGNAIWRELQLEYPRLTSQTRSWHSLRNRYLRYILPSLGSLALPPAQVSRLRAAAAVGKIKSRGNRRNSIFSAPVVRSAATAGRAKPRADRSDQENKKERTPPPPRRARPPVSPSPSKRVPTPSKSPAPSKRVPSPFKRVPSPRLRARPSASSTPTKQKKRRIHHL